MTPTNVSYNLRVIANYLEKHPRPKLPIVLNRLNILAKKIGSPSEETNARTSADVKKFTKKEFTEAIGSIDNLIKRLTKVVNSLNPQDESRESIQSQVQQFEAMKQELQDQYNSITAQI